MPDEDICSVSKINAEAVRQVSDQMLNSETTENLSALFKAMGDPTRLKILFALSKHELCVCDLQAVLRMPQSTISHQLRILRNLRLVRYRRSGRMVFYSLDDEHIHKLLAEGLLHVSHD